MYFLHSEQLLWLHRHGISFTLKSWAEPLALIMSATYAWRLPEMTSTTVHVLSAVSSLSFSLVALTSCSVPYSRKLLREWISLFCGYLWKFSLWNLGAWSPWCSTSKQSVKVFSVKILFFSNSRKFSPLKVSCYIVCFNLSHRCSTPLSHWELSSDVRQSTWNVVIKIYGLWLQANKHTHTACTMQPRWCRTCSGSPQLIYIMQQYIRVVCSESVNTDCTTGLLDWHLYRSVIQSHWLLLKICCVVPPGGCNLASYPGSWWAPTKSLGTRLSVTEYCKCQCSACYYW